MDVHKYYSGKITEAFKLLLISKHLYQNVSIDLNDFHGKVQNLSDIEKYNNGVDLEAKKAKYWLPEINIPSSTPLRGSCMTFFLPNVKLFCKICDRIEAFNPYYLTDQNYKENVKFINKNGHDVSQTFILDYQCQSCHGLPETFLIRRENERLTLCGRIPIEHIDVPKTIPKNQKKYYSAAIIAYQSGHVLSGLFMLRTFIEQYCYEKSPENINYVDKAIDAYMKSLPEDFTQRFPSMRKMYENLSKAIHTAKEDEELFTTTIEEINTHFDAKRLYKI